MFALLAAWAAYSLAGLPPLDRALSATEAHGPLYTLAGVGVPLYGYAAVRYLLLYRRQPAPMPLAVAIAFTLLAEAMAAIAFGRNWRASWWEWHVLMACAFGIVGLHRAERVSPPSLDRRRLQGSLSRAHRRPRRPAVCGRAERARRLARSG